MLTGPWDELACEILEIVKIMYFLMLKPLLLCFFLFVCLFVCFSFNPDPRVRNTFWSLTIGFALTLLPAWGIAQYFVQRYLAVRTLKDAKRSGLNKKQTLRFPRYS